MSNEEKGEAPPMSPGAQRVAAWARANAHLQSGLLNMVGFLSLLSAETAKDLSTPISHGFTLLHYLVIDGHVECVRGLIAKGVNLDCMTVGNQTPLSLAVVHYPNTTYIIDMLLTAGAKVDMVGVDGRMYSALSSACRGMVHTETMLRNGAKTRVNGGERLCLPGGDALLRSWEERCEAVLEPCMPSVGMLDEVMCEVFGGQIDHRDIARVIIDYVGVSKTAAQIRDLEQQFRWQCDNYRAYGQSAGGHFDQFIVHDLFRHDEFMPRLAPFVAVVGGAAVAAVVGDAAVAAVVPRTYNRRNRDGRRNRWVYNRGGGGRGGRR
jgi:hypothetical protein